MSEKLKDLLVRYAENYEKRCKHEANTFHIAGEILDLMANDEEENEPLDPWFLHLGKEHCVLIQRTCRKGETKYTGIEFESINDPKWES